MTEYTSDPAAVAAYYAARARTSNWIQAVSPNAERPSAPPSLVDDTDDGLSSPSPESDYESDLSLPPRMTLKYPDGRLVSIGPSREERDRVERVRKERERERQLGMEAGALACLNFRAGLVATECLYVDARHRASGIREGVCNLSVIRRRWCTCSNDGENISGHPMICRIVLRKVMQ